MTTIQINEEQSKVQEFLDLAIKKFNFNITVLENSNIKSKKSKWEDFAQRMSGLTNPQITKHLENAREDMRENFELRNLSTE